MLLNKLNALVVDWADKRGIITGSTVQDQTVKLIEEFGELASGVARCDLDKIKDSIGDCLVVTIILNAMTNGTDRLFDKMRSFVEPDVQMQTETMLLLKAGDCVGRICWFTSDGENCPFGSNAITTLISLLRDLSFKYDTSIEDCLQLAYDEIKDRKGIMQGGMFVKVADLQKQLDELDKRLAEENFPSEEDSELKRQADMLSDLIIKANR